MPQADDGFLIGGVRLLPMLGDITKLEADAVVQSGGTSVKDEIHLSSWVFQAGQKELGAAVRLLGNVVYWILPNFSAFDLKVQIIYGVALNGKELLLTQLYAVGYLGVVLLLATLAFARREFL